MPEIDAPPVTHGPGGEPRRVGVELEFGAVTADVAAEVVAGVFGGRAERLGPHRFRVAGTRFGAFGCELDSHYAQLEPAVGASGDTEGARRPPLKDAAKRLARASDAAVGAVLRHWIPTEIVAPPIPWHELAALDGLVDRLRAEGARGTSASPVYGFAVQLNPEAAATDAASLRRHLQAYLLASDWLRRQVDVDLLRLLLPFVERFPLDYAVHVLAPGYRPDLGGLIDDYLAFNPTRNRELDLLPLFLWLDRDRVTARVSDARVKARPTFHYRLPNADLEDRTWSIVQEWNRWVRVERLAHDPDRLARMARHWLDNTAKPAPADWATLAAAWLEPEQDGDGAGAR
jgi:hypothetical protein